MLDGNKFSSDKLSSSHLDQLKFPRFLSQTLYDKISVKTKFVEFVQGCIDVIKSGNINSLALEDLAKFTRLIEQMVLNIGFYTNCDKDFKEKLKKVFDNDSFKDRIFDRIVAESSTSDEFNVYTFVKSVESFPEIKTNTLNTLVKDCFYNLKSLPALKNKLSLNIVNYFFGVVFMHLSSVNGFGTEHDSFMCFRLLGAYYLAKSITSKNIIWHMDTVNCIHWQVFNSLSLEGFCSAGITDVLYGELCDDSMSGVSKELSSILNTIIK